MSTQKDKEYKFYGYMALFICLILLFVSIPLLLISPMIFDAPGSENRLSNIIIFYSITTYPVVYIMSAALFLIFKSNKKYKIALISSLLPLINIIAFLGIYMFF